jgi:hypothetical protein
MALHNIFANCPKCDCTASIFNAMMGVCSIKTANKEGDNATRVSVKKEMAKPRTARSARITELNLDTTRIPEQPSTTMPGTVDKIIPPRSSQPEKAQIAVDAADPRRRDHLRIENTLTDEHGDDVKLRKGAHVEVTVTAEPKTVNRRH